MTKKKAIALLESVTANYDLSRKKEVSLFSVFLLARRIYHLMHP